MSSDKARNEEILDEELGAAGPAENEGEPEEVILDVNGEPVSVELAEEVPPPSEEQESAEARFRRLMADFDNFRRRSARDRDEAHQRGRRDAIEKLLPVYDSVAMGLMHTGGDEKARLGLEAVQRQMLLALEKLEVEKIPTVGSPFDPELHEAIAQYPHPEQDEGIICEESRAGFRDPVGLLRPAQVVVSTGKPQ